MIRTSIQLSIGMLLIIIEIGTEIAQKEMIVCLTQLPSHWFPC